MGMKHYCATGTIAAALFVAGFSTAHAAPVLINTVDTGSMIWNMATQDVETGRTLMKGSVVDNGDGTSTFTGMDSVSMMVGGVSTSVWDYNWNITVDPDPFIAASFSVTNTSATTQTFDISFGLPISPSFTDGYMTGNYSASFVDLNGDNSAAVNMFAWEGLIDSAVQMNLSLFSGSCSSATLGCSGNIFPVSDGPLLYTGAANSSIGIHMIFDLSAGDKVTFDTLFDVTPVPVPAAVWLFGSGLLGLVAVARRKAQV